MKKKIKVGLLSKFYPEKDSIARVYVPKLLDIEKEKRHIKIIKIGSINSNCDYTVGMKSIFLYKKIRKIIKKEELDLLHIQYIAPFYSKLLLNLNLLPVYKLNIPIITTMHEVQYSNDLKSNILKIPEKMIVKNSDTVVVHAPYQKKFLEKKYNSKNIKNIYTGLDLKKRSYKKGKNLIFFGMFSKNKGIDKLILAMRQLKDYHLIIAGSIPNNYAKTCYKKLKELKNKHNLKNIDIIAKPWIPNKEKDKLFKKANIAVIPYDWGPYNSGIVQDAAECKLPHAVNQVGAIWEVTDKFKMGEVMKNNSPKEIAKTVKKIDNNYKKYFKGLEEYRKEASWKEVAKKHMELYEKLIK